MDNSTQVVIHTKPNGDKYLGETADTMQIFFTRQAAAVAAGILRLRGYVAEVRYAGFVNYCVLILSEPAPPPAEGEMSSVCRFPDNCLCINLESPPSGCAYRGK